VDRDGRTRGSTFRAGDRTYVFRVAGTECWVYQGLQANGKGLGRGTMHGEVSLRHRILAFGDVLLMAASCIAVAVPGTG